MSRDVHSAWVGMGSNMGDAPGHLRQAAQALDQAVGTNVVRRSSMYRTQPWGEADQPHFINAVIGVHTQLSATALLELMLDLESVMGRVRESRRWGPRLIDLDLLLFDDLMLETGQLVLPHPRMHKRAFVLVPLVELTPELEIPGLGRAARHLEQIGSCGVERLTLPW